MTLAEIRPLIDLRDRVIQKNRIAFGNRLAALENETDEASVSTHLRYNRWHKRFMELEKELNDDIKAEAEGIPIVECLCAVKGVSFTLAAKLVGMIDIERAPTISALWRYAGYAVINGERERPTKGEKLHYNSRLKKDCYLVGSSFLKCSSPYREFYDSAKLDYETKRPEWTKGHRHNAAMRRMIKIFLAHLWMTWRELEGLTTEPPYIIGRNGHNSIVKADRFGWQHMTARPTGRNSGST
jgi:hypothetical protein